MRPGAAQDGGVWCRRKISLSTFRRATLTSDQAAGIAPSMYDSGREILGVIRLVVALVLFVALLGQSVSANPAADTSSSIIHHVDDDDGGHMTAPPSEDLDWGAAGPADENGTAKCCDLFCVGNVVAAFNSNVLVYISTRLKHSSIDAGVVASEWSIPHRPPNA